MKNDEFIGQFKLTSNKLRITDPCYDKDTWCSGTIEDVKNGIWDAHIKTVKSRVAELTAYHSNIKNDTLKKSKWFEHDIDVGVDSGQCGIFDEKFYPEGKTGEYGEENTFYGKCCSLIDKGGVGILDFGVVSTSGYGDGSYVCYTLEEKKEVVGVKIVFIEEESDVIDDFDDDNDDIYQDYSDEDEL